MVDSQDGHAIFDGCFDELSFGHFIAARRPALRWPAFAGRRAVGRAGRLSLPGDSAGILVKAPAGFAAEVAGAYFGAQGP